MEQTVGFQGTRMRSLRLQRGLSGTQLGKLTRISERHIYRLEENERPNVWGSTVARIAVILGTSMDYLYGITDDPTPAFGHTYQPKLWDAAPEGAGEGPK